MFISVLLRCFGSFENPAQFALPTLPRQVNLYLRLSIRRGLGITGHPFRNEKTRHGSAGSFFSLFSAHFEAVDVESALRRLS
ncbi:MAG: hypothetical protein WAZ34_08640 [Rhodocyclaceae bacterium]